MKRMFASLSLILLMVAVPLSSGQASGTSYLQTINRAPTTLAVNASASVIAVPAPLTLTSVVAYPAAGQASGTITFTVNSGDTVVATNSVPVSPEGVGIWIPNLPPGIFTIAAAYSGDSNLLGSTAPGISQTVLGTPNFSLGMDPLVIPQGQSGTATIAVQSLNGFHGPITFTCSTPLASIGCSPIPYVLNVPAPQGQLTASAPGGNVSFNVTTVPEKVVHASLVGALLLSFMSFKRRRKYFVLIAAACLSLLVGCGTGTRYLQTDGTPRGTYELTVTGTSGALSHTQIILVQVK